MNRIRLTEGPVIPVLLKIALPIMGASFVQMAYNLTDMYWIGDEGSLSLAAVGIAGFFVWLSQALVLLARVGTEVKVAQRSGAEDEEGARSYARSGLLLGIGMAVVYTALVIVFRHALIGFFNTQNAFVEGEAVQYLTIVSFGFVFAFLNQIFTGIFNARGSSAAPFKINAVGLLVNMVLDPLLIKGFWIVPKLGVTGAAIATVFAQFLVTAIFAYQVFGRRFLFARFSLLRGGEPARTSSDIRDITKLGMAPAWHSALFTGIAIVIGRLISDFGPEAIAVQKLGTQIESISWMTAHGLSAALSAFIGQNFGARKVDRVRSGYRAGLSLAISIGVATTALLYLGAEFIYQLFVPEPTAIAMGGDYLRILAVSQLFMCVEIAGSGILNGLGRTTPPAVIGVSMNLLRIPMAIWLSMYTPIGLNGIWWAITLTSVFKGIIVFVFLKATMRRVEPA
ncbi:MAG: MATE family efflux transporter [Bacillota bacterium]|nr:MATE family efflux transporter [Bacillota bacterium]